MLSLRISTDELISSVRHPSKVDGITPHFPGEETRDKDTLSILPMVGIADNGGQCSFVASALRLSCPEWEHRVWSLWFSEGAELRHPVPMCTRAGTHMSLYKGEANRTTFKSVHQVKRRNDLQYHAT